jgi:hypothetical protein
MTDKASRNGGGLWRSCLGGRPVPELAGLALGLRFFKQKIQFARRRVLIHLPRPLLVVTPVDPGHQPAEISRGQLFSGALDFFHRAHAAKIPARPCPGNLELHGCRDAPSEEAVGQFSLQKSAGELYWARDVERIMSKLSERCRFFTLEWGGPLALVLFVAFLIAIAVPNYNHGGSSKTNAIVNNLRQLDGAVQYWGIQHQETGAVAVTWEDIAPYIKTEFEVHRGMKPVAGEVYVLKALTQSPEVVLTRTLDGRPKGTVLRFGTNGDLQIILPKP